MKNRDKIILHDRKENLIKISKISGKYIGRVANEYLGMRAVHNGKKQERDYEKF